LSLTTTMICIIALIVFGTLAIFSAKYRPLAKEALDCVFRRVTLRKCRSGLDKRLKSTITGKVMRKHPTLARFIYKHFEIISWAFLILLIASIVQTSISVYNYAAYGNCNGPDEEGFCIFDPLGNNHPALSETSVCPATTGGRGEQQLQPPPLTTIKNNPKTGSANAPVTIIEFGCFSCPNTAKQAPAVKKLIEHFGTQIQFIYVDFPLEQHPYAYEAALAAQCVYEQDPLTYWHYHFLLFQRQKDFSLENFKQWAEELGINPQQYDECMNNNETRRFIDQDIQAGITAGIYGTPTFFINNEPLVGVKPYKLLKAKIEEQLES